MEMYELYLDVKKLNPKAELVGIKTDCLVFNQIKTDIALSDEIGGVKTCRVPESNQYTLTKTVARTGTYDLEYMKWNNIEEDNINNVFRDGLLIYGMAGTGKTTKLKQIKNELHPDEYITICPTHKACNLVDGYTIHRTFSINPIDFSYEYTKAQDLKNAGIKYIFIDEVSMVSERIWCILCHLKKEFNFVFIGFGDFKQLKPVNEEHIDFKNSWLVKHLFNNNSCELTKVHRFDENKLLQDAHDCAYGKSIDFNRYGNQECDLSFSWTNACVDALNTKYNEMYAKSYDNVKEVKGHGNTKFKLHKNLQLMAYTSSLNKKYYNSEDFIVVDFDDDYLYLKTPKKDTIKIDIKFTNHFKPLYAMTVHKAQGMTINKPYSIYEYNRMKHDMLYVALTRTSKEEYVNFCDIKINRQRTGYIYRYSYNNKSYIGCTTDIEKRKEDHKTNATYKFGRAIQEIGYDNFQFEVLDKIKFNDWNELYEVEDEYIIKFDSINNGHNTRRNKKDIHI